MSICEHDLPPLSSLYSQSHTEERPSHETRAHRISRKRVITTHAIFTIINFLNYVDRFSIAAILSDVEDYFKLDDTQKGLIQSVFMLVYLGSAPVFGYLGDRVNRKYILIVAVLTWSASTLCGSFVAADSFWLFLLLHGLVGFGESGYIPVCLAMIGDLFPENERMAAISVFSLAIPVGSGLGYILASSVTSMAEKLGAHEHVAWKYSMRVTPACGLILIILTCLVVRDPPRGAMKLRHESTRNSIGVNKSIWQDVKYLFTNKTLVFVCLGFIMVCYVAGSLSYWVPNFLQDAYKAKELEPDKRYTSIVFGAITCFSGIAGITLGGYVSKKLQRIYPHIEPLVCAFGLLFAAPMIFATLVLAENPSIAMWPFVFFGEVAICLTLPLVPKIIIDCVVPHRRAFAAGLGNLLSHLLGDAFGIYLIGVISDESYSKEKNEYEEFRSLQNGLFTCPVVCAFGAMAFVACSCFHQSDKKRAAEFAPQNTLPIVASQSSIIESDNEDDRHLVIQRSHSISF